MDFSRPEYASYVQLCRELRLERRLVYGDWYFSEKGFLRINVVCFDSLGDADRNLVWLPTLADWLEMLEAAGYDYVRFWPRANPRSWECEAQGVNAPIVTTAFSGGSVFESREEAAARLWVAIRSTRPSAESADPEPESPS